LIQWDKLTTKHTNIQGGSGGNVSILSGDTTGSYEKKEVYIIACLILNDKRGRPI